MNTQLPDYKKNELLIDEVFTPKSYLHKLANQLKLIGQWIENLLIIKIEFKIWHEKDREGHELWKIYDPKTNRTVSLASEEEVRIWIEESFYSRNQNCDRSISSLDLYKQRPFF